MTPGKALALGIAIAGFAPLNVAVAEVSQASVARAGPDRVIIAWTAKGPVDVFVSDRPDATLAQSRRVADDNGQGRFEMAVDTLSRPYILLRDESDGKVTRVAERLVPLLQGSNFRDIGGYPAAGGKHVKWGLIYRSGATPMISPDDATRLKALDLQELVDLRSSEERVLAPSRIEGVPYMAVGYSMTSMMPPTLNTGSPITADRMSSLYREFPTFLRPQMKVLFEGLLVGRGPVAYNCSAGQDRTGFATALILSALGVPRDVIVSDYHLSTTYRRPEFEMPRIDAATAASNPAAALFAGYQRDPAASKPQPLYSAEQRSLILYALEEVDAKWGSVDAYLDKELGITAPDLARLKALYLE